MPYSNSVLPFHVGTLWLLHFFKESEFIDEKIYFTRFLKAKQIIVH